MFASGMLVCAALAHGAPLSTAKPGEIVKVQGSLSDIPARALSIQAAPGPVLLLSDQPERFPGDGVALQERVEPGPVRLYLYHLASGAGKTITVVIENLSEENLYARFSRRAVPPASRDYYHVAQAALLEYLGSSSSLTRWVSPRGRAVLDEELDARTVPPGALVHAIYEFELDQPARISVLQRGPGEDSAAILGKLPHLQTTHGGAGRGTFKTADFEVTAPAAYDTASGPARLAVADGKLDHWVEGTDALSGRPSRDTGNYGTLYRFKLQRRSTDGRALALVMSGNILQSGGMCKGLGTAVKVGGDVVAVPGSGSLSGPFPEAVVLQKYPPLKAGESGTIEFVYSPPGSACLPTPLLLIPYKP